MGIVIDSSVLIATERSEVSGRVYGVAGSEYAETKFLLSSITVMELEHGWHRANPPEVSAKRRREIKM